MSEYWVSKKKYFCKYCEIYIADDAPSRQQHENGMRHKGNTERFIRGLYKGSEKRKKDQDEEKRDMARVEQAAQAAFAQDVAAGLAKFASTPVASTSTTSRKPLPKASNPFANYSTAESLGFKDPDAERLMAEAERRRVQGVAGDWEIVVPSAPSGGTTDVVSEGEQINEAGKREAAAIDDEDTRQFKLRKKTLTNLGEIYDPGVIPIKLKKKEEVVDTPEEVVAPQPVEVPKWTPVQWKRAGDVVPDEKIEEKDVVLSEGYSQVTKEEKSEGLLAHSNTETLPLSVAEDLSVKQEIKSEDVPIVPAASAGSMFRKRKTPASGNRGKRQ